jgi:hypothetical protein
LRFFEGPSLTWPVHQTRASGNTTALFFAGGEQVSLTNVAVYRLGDVLVMGGVVEESTCNGDERLAVHDGLFVGDTEPFDSTDITHLYYGEECAGLRMDSDYNLLQGVKNVECGVSGNAVSSPAGTTDAPSWGWRGLSPAPPGASRQRREPGPLFRR